jgi:hypothetical protein
MLFDLTDVCPLLTKQYIQFGLQIQLQKVLLDQLTKIEIKFRAKMNLKRDLKHSWHMKLKRGETQNNPQPDKDEHQKKRKKHRRFVERNKWKKRQDKKKSQPLTAIYNYSDLTLTEAMTNLLNRGLNFCINPLKLNLTEILVDYRKFDRKLRWKEFFAEKEELQINDWTPDIFPKEKTNVPNKNSKGPNNFINGIRSKLTGTAFNKSRPNIPK